MFGDELKSLENVVLHSLCLAYFLKHPTDNELIKLYLDQLPLDCIGGLDFWEYRYLVDHRCELFWTQEKKLFETGWNNVKELIQANPHLPVSNITIEDYKWAYCISMSRLFSAPTGKGAAALPIAVLINHHFDHNSHWNYVDDAWVFINDVTLEPGMIITATYGGKENIEFLFAYGFAIEGNDVEKGYILRPKPNDGDPIRLSIVNNVLVPLYPDWSEYDRKYGFSQNEMKIMRILLLSPNLKDSYHISKIIDGMTFNEHDVKFYIEQECQKQIELIPGTTKLDTKFVETIKSKLNSNLSSRAQRYWLTQLMLIQYRIDRRKFTEEWCFLKQ